MLGEEDCVYEGAIKNFIPRSNNVNDGMSFRSLISVTFSYLGMIDVEFDDIYCDESMNNPRVPGKVSTSLVMRTRLFLSEFRYGRRVPLA